MSSSRVRFDQAGPANSAFVTFKGCGKAAFREDRTRVTAIIVNERLGF
jgi:hypothetical protein